MEILPGLQAYDLQAARDFLGGDQIALAGTGADFAGVLPSGGGVHVAMPRTARCGTGRDEPHRSCSRRPCRKRRNRRSPSRASCGHAWSGGCEVRSVCSSGSPRNSAIACDLGVGDPDVAGRAGAAMATLGAAKAQAGLVPRLIVIGHDRILVGARPPSEGISVKPSLGARARLFAGGEKAVEFLDGAFVVGIAHPWHVGLRLGHGVVDEDVGGDAAA